MTVWRLLDTGALPGPLNMAIDRALLSCHREGKAPPTLRFYQWNPPTLSLGYFQKHHGIDLAFCREKGIDIVRRPTGGRAVLHQGDLTYSLVAGIVDGIPFSLDSAYRLICDALLAGFRYLGFEAGRGDEVTKSSQPDICFLRTAVGDLVHRRKKFLGSAQTWLGHSLLQHGSIILESQVDTWLSLVTLDQHQKEKLLRELEKRTTSLQEILGRVVAPVEVKEAIIEGMSRTMSAKFEVGELSPREWRLAEEMIPLGTPIGLTG